MRVRLLSQIKCDTTGAKCLKKTWRKYDTRKLEKENYQRTDHNHNDNIDYSYDYSFTPFPLSCILRVTFFTMVRNTYLQLHTIHLCERQPSLARTERLVDRCRFGTPLKKTLDTEKRFTPRDCHSNTDVNTNTGLCRDFRYTFFSHSYQSM